ncbi:MAG TPA: sugar phosphate nucleotidyltransferase, partial [Acetobacteraceae bacterium]|nr:sugar phosphate nucleotidyltransferase [Acetobacteraceae bacterium]
MSEQRVIPVILSGGSGSRLWPVSRESFPKQLWPLISDRSMIQETALRARGPGFAPPVVVCNHEHRFLIAEQLRAAGIDGARVVLEPVGRNSAPAIAAAALLVAESDPDAVLWMMPADHAIPDGGALHRLLARAVEAARQGRVVTFGMKPAAAETGYGYIEVGEALPGLPGIHALTRFIEKPDAPTAATLVASGRHLWNSGMFVFTARTLLEELDRYAPEVVAAVAQAVRERTQDLDFIR